MKSRSKELLDRAIAATVASIDIYNKPDFPYRAETFCILAINAWELLLKAKWLSDNNNKIQSLYVKEYAPKKDGTKSKRFRIKTTRSGNPFTYSIDYLAKKLVEQKTLDQKVINNIEALLELRNSSIHFYNQSGTSLTICLQEIGTACLKNFVLATEAWFARDLREFNFYLMPLSFVNPPQQRDAIVLNKEEKNFLSYLESLDALTDKDDSEYAFMLNIDVKFTRSKTKDAIEVRTTINPNALEVQLTEEQIRDKYPWDYNKLTTECSKRYTDFKRDQKYHTIRKSVAENRKFCYIRYLDPANRKGAKKPFYHPNITQEMDEHYSAKR